LTTRYDGCITVDKTQKSVRVYRYVSYSNGQNNLLDNSTYNFDTLEEAMQFAERMHGHYKADGVSLVVTD
jgi:riboflavin synthase alpha subunit